MGLSKEQVERHISGVKQRLSTEKEYNLHGFEFAKLCLKVKNYEDAIRYLTGYLSEKEHDYRAQKWIGHAYEAIGNMSKALVHYKRSLEVKEQKGLIIAVAQLQCQLDTTPISDLKNSLVRLQSSTADHPLVFQLNEKIRSLEGSFPLEFIPHQMQTFSSIDIEMHIRFVKQYSVSGKLDQAFEYCQLVGSKGYFFDSILWQTCVLETTEEYHQQLNGSCSTGTDAEKILEVLIALLEAICCLFHLTADISKDCLLKCLAYLTKYDKVLFAAVSKFKSIPSILQTHYQVSVRDLCGQLYFMVACYLFLAGHSTSINTVNSVNAFQLGELCLLASLQATPPVPAGVLSQRFASRSFFERWHKAACARLSIVGRLLTIIASSKGIVYLKTLPKAIYSKGGKLTLIKSLFGGNPASIDDRLDVEYSLQESFLAGDNLIDLAVELPEQEDLILCDQEFVYRNGANLRGLVWLCLSYKALDVEPPVSEWLNLIFDGLKLDAQDLTRSDPNTLSLCDIEAFLVLLVNQRHAAILKASGSQSASVAMQAMCALLPCCIRIDSESLDWWNSIFKMLNSNMSAHESILVKRTVRTNLGIVRGCRPLQLYIDQLTTLARHFKAKAEKIVQSADSQSLNYRSLVSTLLKWSSHYWTIICNIPVEASSESILSEARMTLANAALYENDLSTALQLYSMVETPQAAWNLSQIYLLKAEHGHQIMEDVDSVDTHSANLKKALEMTTVALTRLNPIDNLKIRDTLIAQQEELKQLLSDSESSPVACSLDYGVAAIVPHYSSTPSKDNSDLFPTENNQSTIFSVDESTETLTESLKEKEEQLSSTKTYLQQLQAEMEEIKQKLAGTPEQTTTSWQTPQQLFGYGDEMPMENSLLESAYSPLHSVTSESVGATCTPYPISVQSSSTSFTFGRYFKESESASKPVVSSISSIVLTSGCQTTGAPQQSLAGSSEPPICKPTSAANKPFLFVPKICGPLSFSTSTNLSTAACVTDSVPPSTTLLFGSQVGVQHSPFQSSKLVSPSFSLGGPISTVSFSPAKTTSTLSTSIGDSTSNIFMNLPALSVASKSVSQLPKLPQNTNSTFSLSSLNTHPSSIVPTFTAVSEMPQKFPLLSLLSEQPPSANNPFFCQTSNTSLKAIPMPHTMSAPMTSIFGLHSTQTLPVIESAMRNDPKNTSEEHQVDSSEEIEITPIVSLPLVDDIKSGEEEETVLFSCRAKLYRFDNSQWRERGLGDMKILKHQVSGKVRLVMRREQVLKLCCNHYVTADMSLTPFSGGTSAWAWYTPHDFADGVSKPEKLAIKFKRQESAKHFRSILEECIADLASEAEDRCTDGTNVSVPTIASSKSLSHLVSKQGSWYCDACYVVNDSTVQFCVACNSKRLGASPQALISNPLLIQNKWTCSECYVQNDSCCAKCAACEASKPSEINDKGSAATLHSHSLNSMGRSDEKNIPSSTMPALLPKPVIGVHGGLKIAELSFPKKSAPTLTTKQDSGELQHGFKIPDLNLSKLAMTKSEESINFHPVDQTGATQTDISGGDTTKLAIKPNTTFPQCAPKDSPFSSISSPLSSFQGFNTSVPNTFSNAPFALGQKIESSSHVRSEAISVPTTLSLSADSTQYQQPDNIDTSLEKEPNVYFKPLVVLEEAEMMTGEENEEVLFSHRAKLYRFDGSVGQWKEKGIGNMKILKHKQSNIVRVLMRREQVLKICCNHRLLPHMSLSPLPNSDRAWVWYTSGEFADETCKAEQLAIKFKERDTAESFKKVFDDCVPSLSSNKPRISSMYTMDQVQNDNSDVEITHIELPSNERRNLAKKFMLPETFYNYENMDPCPGCRGCLGEDQFDTPTQRVGGEPAPQTHHQTKNENSSESGIDRDMKPPLFSTTSSKAPLSFADVATCTSASTIPFQLDSSKGFQGAGDLLFMTSTEATDDSSAEADIQFEPLISLPEVPVSTGEENETVLFSQRAKLFRFSGTVWKERGIGDIRILMNKCTKKARVLMRREQVLKICCNHTITAEMTLVPNQGSEKSWTWYTPCDFADEVSKPEKFAVRFKHSDTAKKFKEVFDSCVFNSAKTSSENQGNFSTSRTLAERFASPPRSWRCDVCYVLNSDMKESCSACDAKKPTHKLESLPTKEDERSSTFTPLPTAVDVSPCSTSSIRTEPEISTISPLTDVSQMPKSSVQMSVKDEADKFSVNEQEVFSCTAELLCQDCEVNDWVTKGCGTMKILKNVSTGNQRVLMTRCEPQPSVLCSHPITSLMRLRNVTGQDFSWVWNGYEDDTTSGTTHFLKYCVKFGEQAPAEMFKHNFKASQSLLNYSQLSRNKSESESMTSEETEHPLMPSSPIASTHFSENRDDVKQNEVIFLFEELPDLELIEKATKFMLPKSFYLYEKKAQCPGCRGCTNESDIFVSTAASLCTQIEQSRTSSETTGNISVPDNRTEHFLSTNMLSFSDIVSSSDSVSVQFGKVSGFQFQGAGTQLFPSRVANQDSENPEMEADIKFEPIISLPEVTTFKSWDDEADALFVHRAKLFRYDSSSSQWKERGVGDLKILRHKLTRRVRLIMRREQILKICCNHYITEGIELLPGTSDRSWIWFTPNDFSDDEPKAEKLAARFKHAETAQEFHRIFVECVRQSKTISLDQVTPVDQATFVSPHADKSWECSVCYVRNKPECYYCCACQSHNTNVDKTKHLQETTDSSALHSSTSISPSNEKDC